MKTNKLFSILMMLLLMLSTTVFYSCSKDEDDDTQLLISLKGGSSGIDGIVYVFPDGDYDPKTFEISTLGSIKTKSGQKVTALGVGSYKKNEGYCKYECKPGKYYVVGVYLGSNSWGGIPSLTWKGQSTIATKDGSTIVEIQLSTFSSGCQN